MSDADATPGAIPLELREPELGDERPVARNEWLTVLAWRARHHHRRAGFLGVRQRPPDQAVLDLQPVGNLAQLATGSPPASFGCMSK